MKSEASVWGYASQLVVELEHWLEHNDGRTGPLHLKRIDQLKLMRLRTWALRYKLPVQEILTLVMPVLRGQVKSKKKPFGLGFRVGVLVGNGAQRILLQEITKIYPCNEHIFAWRSQERERQLRIEQEIETDGLPVRVPKALTVLSCTTVESFISQYKNRITALRETTAKEETSRWRKKRHYRGNPWV